MKINSRSSLRTTTTWTALFLAAATLAASACPACYGDTSGSKMGNAAQVGIFAMVVIMFLMLGAVAGFGFYLNYRAKHPLPDYHELMSDDSTEPQPGPTI
jgi:hypothetical protein